TAAFSGGTSGVPLTVQVNGNGKVTGGSINCPATCSQTSAVNSTVTLTETPGSGATFTGWGGACSRTAAPRSVTMNAATTVTAPSSGGTSCTLQLTVHVVGTGRVTGGGLDCGTTLKSCFVAEPANSTVTLTAAPATGGKFTGWSGACTGAATTCKVTMNAAK